MDKAIWRRRMGINGSLHSLSWGAREGKRPAREDFASWGQDKLPLACRDGGHLLDHLHVHLLGGGGGCLHRHLRAVGHFTELPAEGQRGNSQPAGCIFSSIRFILSHIRFILSHMTQLTLCVVNSLFFHPGLSSTLIVIISAVF